MNASQSSNDVFPSAIHLAADARVDRRPDPGARAPRRRRCGASSAAFKTVVKAGRTHLMDATPVTLGQEFGGYATGHRARHRAARRRRCLASASCRSAAPRSAPASTPAWRSRKRAIAKLADRHGAAAHRGARPLRGAGRARRARRSLGRLSRVIAVALIKIANDIRWMGSGPRRARRDPHPRPAAGLVDHAGQGEPGRGRGGAAGVAQVIGNDAAVAFAERRATSSST